MNVMPTSSWRAFSSIWRRLRSLASSAPSGSSSRRTLGFRIRARASDALLLAAGQLVRAALGELRHLHELERITDPLGGLLFRGLLVLEPEGDVLLDGEVREERVVLEDRVHVALVRRGLGHVDLVEEDLALGRALEARDHAQGGRFAAARWAEEREELARRHLQVDPGDGGELTEALHQVDELDLSPCHSWRSIPFGAPRESTASREGRRRQGHDGRKPTEARA
jgi:hypothetical protein